MENPTPDSEFTVFYAWQSDSSTRVNRNFIESALDQAFKNLHKAGKVEFSPRLDKDTKNVPGTPDIANTIFEKIRVADAFVADVSFVGKSWSQEDKVKLLPNPNVMVELGYAVAELGWERIALVLNTETGAPDELPFDLRNRRWPVAYKISSATDESDRSAEKKKLTGQLEEAIAAIVELPPRQKAGTTSQRLDALETMVSSLSGSVAQYTTLANLVSGLQQVATGVRVEGSDPKVECQKQLNDLIKRLSAGQFENVAFQEGMLAMVIRPTSAPTPLPIFSPANDAMLNLALRPMGASGWDQRTYGERFVTFSGTRDQFDAATELTAKGEINAASHRVISLSAEFYALTGKQQPADTLGIPSVAFEKKIIESVHMYLRAIKELGTQGPWYVAFGIVNLKKSFLYVDPQFAFGGRRFDGNEIMPGVVEISADIALENPQAVARALRPLFDYVWRDHGYPQSINYAVNGDWIGR